MRLDNPWALLAHSPLWKQMPTETALQKGVYASVIKPYDGSIEETHTGSERAT